MQQHKPWQWLIDDIKADIEFYEKHGMDKDNPELYERFKIMLKKAELKQANAMKSI